MEPITPEQQQDIDERVAEFQRRHEENVKELACEFVAYPQYVQIGPGVFGTFQALQIVDKKYAPIESPIQREEIEKA